MEAQRRGEITADASSENYNPVDKIRLKASLTPMRHRDIPVLLFLFCCCASAAFAVPPQTPPSFAPATTLTPYLYKVSLVQAAPGKLLDLIDVYKSQRSEERRVGKECRSRGWLHH